MAASSTWKRMRLEYKKVVYHLSGKIRSSDYSIFRQWVTQWRVAQGGEVLTEDDRFVEVIHKYYVMKKDRSSIHSEIAKKIHSVITKKIHSGQKIHSGIEQIPSSFITSLVPVDGNNKLYLVAYYGDTLPAKLQLDCGDTVNFYTIQECNESKERKAIKSFAGFGGQRRIFNNQFFSR